MFVWDGKDGLSELAVAVILVSPVTGSGARGSI